MTMMVDQIKEVSMRLGLAGEITEEVKKIAIEEFEMTINRIHTSTTDVVIEKAREHFARTLDRLSAE